MPRLWLFMSSDTGRGGKIQREVQRVLGKNGGGGYNITMNIQILSDLHMEFGSQYQIYQIEQCQSDIVILAGDTDVAKNIISSIKWIYSKLNKHLVVIMGNHEYYYSTKQYVDEQLKFFDDHEYIHVLNNSTWEYNGVVFLGSTGWWTMDAAQNAVIFMADYDIIHDIKSARNGLDWGWESYEFFRANLKKYDKRITGKTVVCVSHNAPSLLSVGEEFKDSPLNPCFTNAWQHLMLEGKPIMWVHGHMHGSNDYMFDDTRIICNPYGYSGHSLNKNFDPHKVIEL